MSKFFLKKYSSYSITKSFLLLAIVAVLISCFGCSKDVGVRNNLVIADDIQIDSLDPARNFSITGSIYQLSVYEQLLSLDSSNKYMPLLAKSWSVNDEQSKFIFMLDSNARFSDGSPVESKDVKWSLERLKNIQHHGSYVANFISAIETPDAQTVIITLLRPHSDFLQIAASGMFSIVNSDVAIANGALSDKTAAQYDQAEAWFLTHSAGSGPFVLESYSPGKELRLTRNENYWGTKALVPSVVFLQVSNADLQAEMLRSGAVDIAMQVNLRAARLLEGSGIKFIIEPSDNFIYLGLAPGAEGIGVNLSPEVRLAISLAIDRKALIELTLGSDGGRLLSAPIPLGFPGGQGHSIPEFNPSKAKKLLAGAGLANGFKLKSIYPDLNVFGVNLSVMMKGVQQDLLKVGIELELFPVSFEAWRNATNGKHIPLTAVFFIPDYFGTSQYVHYFGLSRGSVWANRAGAANYPSLLNPRTSVLKRKALAARTAEEANQLWFEAGEEMIGSRIILPLMSPNRVVAFRANIKGIKPSACCELALDEISK
jgi:peptide/nickel transport system substrate-binding protein